MVSLKFITKFATNFSHFAWTIRNKIKPRGIFTLKHAPLSVLISPTLNFEWILNEFWMNFEWKSRETLSECHNILDKVVSNYSLVQNPTCKQNAMVTISNKIFHPIGLYHPLDGITNPKYKLLCSLTTNFLQREEGTSF
jgi:hypothetical protein